jgi:hypothetical protein
VLAQIVAVGICLWHVTCISVEPISPLIYTTWLVAMAWDWTSRVVYGPAFGELSVVWFHISLGEMCPVSSEQWKCEEVVYG